MIRLKQIKLAQIKLKKTRSHSLFLSTKFLLINIILLFCVYAFAEQDHSNHVQESNAIKHDKHSGHDHSNHKNSIQKSKTVEHNNNSNDQHSNHQSHTQHSHTQPNHSQHKMELNHSGMVMHSNEKQLPKECKNISKDYEFTVYAGGEYAKAFSDKVFGYSDYELKVEPCSRIKITFVNKDEVRHQWMVHGLPRYLYGQGMFHLEAAGNSEVTGVFIVPSDNKTYLIHCDIAQHMEKGMKAQLIVGSGSGNLWAIPGVSGDVSRSNYLPKSIWFIGLCIFIVAGTLAYRFYPYKN